jgi:hypothetical protein
MVSPGPRWNRHAKGLTVVPQTVHPRAWGACGRNKKGAVMTWYIVVLKTYTGDVSYYVATYHNRGQAVARLRGLMRSARTSELRYALRRGR